MSGFGYYNPIPAQIGGGDTFIEQEHRNILTALERGFGADEDTEAYWEAYAEASSVALIWAVNQRLKSQALPETMIEELPVWEEATNIIVGPRASDHDRRLRLAAKLRGVANNALSDIEAIAQKMLSFRFDGVEITSPANRISYWAGMNPGPPGKEWSTNRTLVNVKVKKDGLTEGEFTDLVGQLSEQLFQTIPVWMGANVSVDGVWLLNQGVLNQTVIKAPSVALWAPTELSGLSVWLRPDIETTVSSGEVSAINDRSGNTNDFIPSGSPNPDYEAFGLGGKPAINFNGTNERLLAADDITMDVGTGSFLVIMACELISSTGVQCAIGKGNNASADNIRCTFDASNFPQIMWGSDAQKYAAGTTAVSLGVPTIVAWGVDDTTNESIYVVGGVIERASISISGTGSNALAMHIGEDVAGNLNCNIKIADLAMYKRTGSAIPNSDIERLIQYMSARYNL